MVDGTFDAAIGDGWTTDAAAAIVADCAGNGAPADLVNSVRLQRTTANGHLLSPQVEVTPGNYIISAHLDIKDRSTGEVGWYIYKYDTDGNWISGQWMLDSTTLGVSDVHLTYSPRSADVTKANLQVYVTGDPEVLAYVDDLRWWRP